MNKNTLIKAIFECLDCGKDCAADEISDKGLDIHCPHCDGLLELKETLEFERNATMHDRIIKGL